MSVRKVRFKNGAKKLYPGIPSRCGRAIEKQRNERSSEAVKNAGRYCTHG
jgi:hypothetical protein